MSRLKNMRAIEIPRFRAVSFGLKTFDELFGDDGFSRWADVENAHIIATITISTKRLTV